MEMTYAMWLLAAGVVGVAAYALRSVIAARSSSEFEAGAVSQSWLIQHRGGPGDRFS
jgi:hypothetical protein